MVESLSFRLPWFQLNSCRMVIHSATIFMPCHSHDSLVCRCIGSAFTPGIPQVKWTNLQDSGKVDTYLDERYCRNFPVSLQKSNWVSLHTQVSHVAREARNGIARSPGG